MTMTAPLPSTPAPLAADSAALIASFYGRAGRLQWLVDQLVPALALQAIPADDDLWTDPAGEVILRRFHPPDIPDTVVEQLTLDAPDHGEDAAAVWPRLATRLREPFYIKPFMEDFWGCTLIYQAMLRPGVTAGTALGAVLPSARRLLPLDARQSLTAPLGVLAEAALPGGHLWLLDIPVLADGVGAATIYVALGPASTQQQFVEGTLLGTGATLLRPDLIAHKGYHAMRQYRLGDIVDAYSAHVSALLGATSDLLGDIDSGQRDALVRVGRAYERIAPTVPNLDALRISMSYHLRNYERALRAMGADIHAAPAVDAHGAIDIFPFHWLRLEAGYQELELLTARGQSALQSTRAATDIVRTRIEEDEGRRERLVATAIGVVGVLLALTQLIDKTVAGAFLNWLADRGLPRWLSPSSPTEAYSPENLKLLAVQLALMAVIALVCWQGLKCRSALKRRGRVPPAHQRWLSPGTE